MERRPSMDVGGAGVAYCSDEMEGWNSVRWGGSLETEAALLEAKWVIVLSCRGA